VPIPAEVEMLDESVRAGSGPYSALRSGPRPVARSTSPLARAANADLRYEHAKKRRPLTALLLAYNLFGDSFFEASCRLGGKPTGRFL